MTGESENGVSEIDRSTRRRIRWGAIGLTIILLVYTCILVKHFVPAITEPDANGYWAQGSRLVTTGQSWFKTTSDAQFIGMHWLLTPDGKLVSRYPPGLALLIGAVYAALGHKAAVFVNPALALMTLVGFYLLLRRLFTEPWALMGVLVLGFNPTFAQHALANDSHMAVTCCVVWGIYLLLRWSEQPRWWTILLAGTIFGCIPSIRYPDAVMGLAVAAFLFAHWRRPKFAMHLLCALLGAAIPIALLMGRNQQVFGTWWKTGYSLTNEQTGFGWGYFRDHWLQYVDSLNGSGLGLLFGLGLAAMTTMLFVQRWRALGLLLSLMCVPMVLLYTAYYWAPDFSAATLRFLLPIVPCFIIAGLWLLDQITLSAPRAARVAVPAVVLLLQLAWAAAQLPGGARNLEHSKQILASVTDGLVEVANDGDVVISQNQLLQHLDYVGHWKLADAGLVGMGFGGGPGGPMPGPGYGPRGRGGPGFGPPGRGPNAGIDADPDAPSPMQQEKNRAQRALYQGFDAPRQFAGDVFAWGQDRKVWLVGPEFEVSQEAQMLWPESTVEIVKRIELPPTPPIEEEMMGRGGRGPGGRGRMGGPSGPPMRGGRGQGGPGGPGGPGGRGGPMAPAFQGATEVVIARWSPPAQ